MTSNTFDVQYWPSWNGSRTEFGTAGYVILKSAADKDLAWEFYKYAVTKHAMTLQLDGNGTTPTRKSMLTAQRYAPTGPAHWSVFYPTLDRGGHACNSRATVLPRICQHLCKYTTLAVTKGMAPKQALDSMQSDLESVYKSGGNGGI